MQLQNSIPCWYAWELHNWPYAHHNSGKISGFNIYPVASVVLYRRKKKNLALSLFSSHKRMFNYVFCSKSCFAWIAAGRCKIQQGPNMCLHWCPDPPTLPPPPSFGGHVCLFKCGVLSIVLLVPRIVVTWNCDQLDWFSLFTFINTNSHFTRTPQGIRVSWLLFRL